MPKPINRVLNTLIPFCLTIAALPPCGGASQHVLVLEKDAGQWQLLTVTGVQLNDRDRVLLYVPPAAQKPLHGTVYRQLKPIRIADASAFVTGPQGAGVMLTGLPDSYATVVPDGFRLDTPSAPDHLWKSSWFSYLSELKRAKRQAVAAPQVFALVPVRTHPADALADFVLSPEHFFDQGPGSDGFRKRMSLLAAVAAEYPNHAAALRLSEYVYREMAGRWTSLEKHESGYRTLTDSLAFAAVSERIRPADERHRQLRASLTGYQERIVREQAALKALAAGHQADALVNSYGEFERFDDHFPDVRAARGAAYESSAALHYEKALKAYEAGRIDDAKSELATVLRRAPGFEEGRALADHVQIAATRGARRETAPQASAFQKTSLRWESPAAPQGAVSAGQLQMQRYLNLADELTRANKLAEAKAEIGKAIFLDPKSAGIRLSLARLRTAESDPLGALAQLDDYDARATGSGAAEGESVRAMAGRDLHLKKADLTRRIKEAVAAKRYDESLRLSVDGLATVDPAEPDFLYYAGASSAILRRRPAAADLLQRFLEASESLTGDRAKRLMARRILTLLDRPVNPPNLPAKSWFSAWSLDAGSFYDPVSGIFQPRVASVRGSNGANILFRWDGARLDSVSEDRVDSHTGANVARILSAGLAAANHGRASVMLERADREHSGFYFHYEGNMPQVVRVTHNRESVDGGTSQLRIQAPQTINGLVVRAAKADLSEAAGAAAVQRDASQGFLTLLNGPGIDPLIAEAFTGEPAAYGFAPNAYFHPFAWERIHLFALSYDDEGRIRSARDTSRLTQPLEFHWYGQRLEKIVQHAGPDPRSAVVYERTMHYAGDRLTAETTRFHGKVSRIDYRYDADHRLVEAVSQADESVGRIARRVSFRQ